MLAFPAMDTTAEVLRAAALDLTRTLDLEEVLDKLLAHLERLVPYDTANVMLVEDEDARLNVRAIRGYEVWGDAAAVRRGSFPLDTHPILNQLLRDRRSLLIPETIGAAGWQLHDGAHHVRSWMGVPLISGDRVIGLYAVDKSTPHFFTQDHVRATEALAPYAAIAIVNARLFERGESLNQSLARQVAEFKTLLEVMPIGIAVARDPECRWIDGNQYLARQFGIPAGANASFSNPGDALQGAEIRQDGRPLPASRMPMQHAIATGAEVLDMEMEVVRDGRTVATILGYAAPLFDEAGRPRGAIGASLDITERKRAEEQIRSLAYKDSLTGLPNRLLFGDRLRVAVAQAHRVGQRLAVLFLDLDRLKVINDSLGHSVGDRMIAEVGQRLRTCVREGDTVARLGGDEFTLLLPGITQVVDAAKVAEKVLEVLRAPVHVDGRELFVTASLGISVYPEDGRDAETLLKNADTAMYRAKDQGRDHYQLYTSAMNATALERLALESSLRKALAQDELVLYYQPVLDLASGRVHGVESLLRWRHPEMGLVSPAEFVPLAELTGLILPMGPWTLRTACRQAQAWRRQLSSDLTVAVNLSARQFQQPDLAGQVAAALEEAGLQPRLLELEITESNAMHHAESTIRTLRELKSLGVRLSIDDFGTGYSSLSYLKRFPIDTLKIDQSFIRDISTDPDDAAIATAVIAMARTLELDVVAEGVETEEQLQFLADHGCDRIQGYVFSPAVSAERCGEVLARHQPRARV
jgi:diguanylate cyclase (GGDEF)-like protein